MEAAAHCLRCTSLRPTAKDVVTILTAVEDGPRESSDGSKLSAQKHKAQPPTAPASDSQHHDREVRQQAHTYDPTLSQVHFTLAFFGPHATQ